MTLRILSLVLFSIAPLAAGELIQLGDEHFAVKIETPVSDWIAEHGPRFDTTAAVTSVRVDGTEFLAHCGLADEFNPKWISPPGFDQAQPGDPFLKIGVGVLLRKSTWRYFFRTHYAIRRLAEVDRLPVGEGTDAGFRQRFDSELGWAYDYEKSYTINPDARELTMRYRMKNTGDKPFTIEQYNHNWFAFAATSVPGAAHELEAPFILNEGLRVDGMQLDPVYRVAEQTTPASANRVLLRNATDGRWVELTGDFAVSRFALAVDANTFSPEVFGRWTLAPGEQADWSRTYRFGIQKDQRP